VLGSKGLPVLSNYNLQRMARSESAVLKTQGSHPCSTDSKPCG